MTQPVLYDNLYEPKNVAGQSETKRFEQIISDAIEAGLLDTHTMLPAQVVSLTGNSYCSIKILLKRRYKSGDLVELPIIQNVPINFPEGGGYSFRFPVNPGDRGMAIFSERSLDTWIASDGGVVDPGDPRTHDLTDAVFVPGLNPLSSQGPSAGGGVQINCGTHIHLNGSHVQLSGGGAHVFAGGDAALISGGGLIASQSGKVYAGDGSNDIVDLLTQLTDYVKSIANFLSTTTVLTMLGPEPLSTAANFTSLVSDLTTLETDVESIQGDYTLQQDEDEGD